MVVCTSFLCQCIVYGLCFYTNCSPDQKSKRCLCQTMSDQPYMNTLSHSIDSCNHTLTLTHTHIDYRARTTTFTHLHTHTYSHSQPHTHTKTHAHLYTYPHLHSTLWIYVHSCTHTPTSHINWLIHIFMHTYHTQHIHTSTLPFLCIDTNQGFP